MNPETLWWPCKGGQDDRIRVLNSYIDALRGATSTGPIYLLDLYSPKKFLEELPIEFRAPTQLMPNAGIPSRVWAGYSIHELNSTALADVRNLLEVQSRIRWIDIKCASNKILKKLVPLLESWRCSNCGSRGEKRPGKCPYEKVCGDSVLLPQIHWLVGNVPDWLATKAKKLGITVTPEVPR